MDGSDGSVHLYLSHAARDGELKMSVNNIVGVQVVANGAAVIVTFKTNRGKAQRSYLYSSLEAVKGILAGEDPSQWGSVRVDDSGSGAGVVLDSAADKVGGMFEDAATDIGELGAL
jgi:hypothetical protein